MKTVNKVEVDYAVADGRRRRGRQDAAWYVDGDGHTWVATVTVGGNAVHVYCDGEMRIVVDDDVVRTTGDLIGLGITSDRKLFAANESGRTWWENNAWFDLYDNGGHHLDCVCDTLNEAIRMATELINQYPNKGDNQ